MRWWRLTRSCWAEEHEPHEHAGSPHLAHSVADHDPTTSANETAENFFLPNLERGRVVFTPR